MVSRVMSPLPVVSLPVYAQLERVGQCNLRCQMCAIQYREDGPPFGALAFMAFDLFVRVLDSLPTLRKLHLQGLGEPMMHPRFFEMIALATARGIQVTTNANATLLNERRAEQSVTSGLDRLHISLDSASAATYERIRVRARFERVVANAERLLTVRERLHATTPRLTMVLMRQNLRELPDLIHLANQWGIEELFVQHLCHDFGEASLPVRHRPMRAFVDEQALLHENPEVVASAFSETRELAHTLGVDLRLPRAQPRAHPSGTPGRQRCDWPWRGAYISYDGYAMPCCVVSTPDQINFGNVAEGGMTALWNSVDYQAFRVRLDSDDPPECANRAQSTQVSSSGDTFTPIDMRLYPVERRMASDCARKEPR